MHIILAIYASALERRPVNLSYRPEGKELREG